MIEELVANGYLPFDKAKKIYHIENMRNYRSLKNCMVLEKIIFMKINCPVVIKWSLILVLDCCVVFILCLLLQDYEDSYNESKGQYWSLSSMTTFQKVIHISLDIWLSLNYLFFMNLLIKTLFSWWFKLKEKN